MATKIPKDLIDFTTFDADDVTEGATNKFATTANVDSAGAVMNSDASTGSMSFVVDEDNMVSDSATKVPTQQSVKAFVENSINIDNDFSGTVTSTSISGTPTIIKYTSTEINDGTAYNTGTGVWTCAAAGRYLVTAAVCSDPGTTNQELFCEIRLNGAMVRESSIERNTSGSGEISSTCVYYADLSVSDTIEIYAHTASVSDVLSGVSGRNYLHITRVK